MTGIRIMEISPGIRLWKTSGLPQGKTSTNVEHRILGMDNGSSSTSGIWASLRFTETACNRVGR
jgi:hypothetical protein